MSDQSLETNQEQATDATNQETVKTYTQEEFDRHMAGLKSSLQKKYEKTYSDLGDINELRELKTQAEAKQLEDAKKRGEFDKLMKELADRKDAEISKRDTVISEYKINTPLLSAAAKYNAVNAEQVKSLLSPNIRMNDSGEVEVVDGKGSVRYSDKGEPIGVEDLVREFLDTNPHFKLANPATTQTRSNAIDKGSYKKMDVSKLDMRNPEHRAAYKEYKKASGLK
jgi:hypothetical protein